MTVINRGVTIDDTAGMRLRRARIDKNISIKDLASLCGVTTTCIIYIEGNKSVASPPNLRKLANLLNVPIFYLGCYEDLPEESFGERLTKARLFHGYTKIEISEQLGIDVKLLRSWESGRNKPHSHHMYEIEKFLKILNK